jgi:flagellar motor switch protein FliG
MASSLFSKVEEDELFQKFETDFRNELIKVWRALKEFSEESSENLEIVLNGNDVNHNNEKLIKVIRKALEPKKIQYYIPYWFQCALVLNKLNDAHKQ